MDLFRSKDRIQAPWLVSLWDFSNLGQLKHLSSEEAEDPVIAAARAEIEV
ncbi:hypothetical protein RND71_043773 [Anisodus tanguticus]|uniref:Uncharacterized protein n=1 Tax=Anisodus tanguticus TaxID=243964 RepID=A0AAE1QPN1_9SOLA|nr:hypothetical protein RND71_043773 [Anisodus tanguticus]